MPNPTVDPYDPGATATTFDLDRWMVDQDWALLDTPEGRRVLTRVDPMLFAVVYLPHHLAGEDSGAGMSFADAHFQWFRLMREWAGPRPGPRGWRHSFAAPRSCGKSTMWFTIAPLWAAMHGHARFVAAFADSGTQAEMHLQTFRAECANNRMLRLDYPDVCTARRKPTGRTVADNEGMYQCRSGFVFAARGVDTASLGMKVSETRPDILILDDIEKHEALYSLDMVGKRLATIINAIFPLNERARVVIVGTTTRYDSIIHQLVQVADQAAPPTGRLSWISEEKITPHHHLPIVADDQGGERSIWPAKWSLEYLRGIRGTRSYQLNMECDPLGVSGDYWDSGDYLYGWPSTEVARLYCWVDPPVTTRKTSDPAGVVIAAYLPHGAGSLPELLDNGLNTHLDQDARTRVLARQRLSGGAGGPWLPGGSGGAGAPSVLLLHAEEVRLTGRPLLRHVASVINRVGGRHGRRVRAVLCEVNQGGDLWREYADELAVPLRTFSSSRAKSERIEDSLDFYQARRVLHVEPLHTLQRQQLDYPKLKNDDVIDAAALAILGFLDPKRHPQSGTIFPR